MRESSAKGGCKSVYRVFKVCTQGVPDQTPGYDYGVPFR